MRDQKYQNVTLFKRRRGIVALASALTGWSIYFLLFLLAILWAFACRVEHRSPANKHKETFLLFALFTDEKRGKSHLRGLSSLLKNTFRVHELVARAVRGECVRQMAE